MSVSPGSVRRIVAPALAVLLAVTVLAFAPPQAQAHEGHGHVLVFTEAPAGPWHDAAIAEGTPKVKAALEAEGMEVTVADDSTGVFTDEGLAEFDAIVAFQINGDPWTADEKAAMERWMAAGNGIAAVHNATDMRGDYAWWDEMVGSLMPGHAATGTDPGQEGVVRVEDHTHPSTAHLTDNRWTRSDEWYNFSNNVRGTAHVLATMDESTYDAGGNKMGYDHPISWCKPYEGGRFWATGMGHFPSHFDEPALMAHLVGGVKYVAGLEPGDCGGTMWESYEKVALDENTSAPFAMDVAPDGKVFYTELVRGQIRVYDPASQTTETAIEIPVYSGGEDGLLGIALANDFMSSGHLYLYYAPASDDDTDPANFFSNLSRLTYDHTTGTIDRSTEKVLLKVPARRLPDEPGHTGGGLGMDADGNLYLGVGDDVNPHSEPSGGYAPLSTRAGTFHDARETSANTNDLRGKLLRIHPEADGSYTIPEGNLFPESADPGDKTLPEIYAMGFRNPFRFSIDPATGWVGMADYSPDNGNDAPATRGPAGIAEYNVIKSPGNYGWPLCMGDNEAFRDVDYTTNPVTVGDYFDCANPVNDSPRNTGLTDLPPARAADMFYGYQRTSVPGVINAGGGLAPMGGPFYEYDAALDSDTKFPEYFDGKSFFYEWARNKMYSVQLTDTVGAAPGDGVEKVNPFLPQEQFLAPIDSKFGPDGSLYVLDWGGGFGRDNPSSGLHRIDYIQGSRSPIADIVADRTSGPAPLTVAFDGAGSSDPENAELGFAWDFDDDGTVDSTEVAPSHTYDTDGVFSARLTVTDPDGKDGTTTVPITVGNTEPEVVFNLPPDGSFFDFGDDLTWDVSVTDAEDGAVDGNDVIIQPALGHDDHAHPTLPLSGLTGTTPTSLGGHAADEDIFFAIDARYTDSGGAGGANPLTGSETTLVLPKIQQAEFFEETSESMTVVDSRDLAGGERDKALSGQDGAWAAYSPVNLHRIDQVALRVSANAAGTIELRKDAPDGELLASAEVPATGPQRYADVLVDVTDPGETFELYVVLPGEGQRRFSFFEAIGQGSSPDTRPTVRITAPEEGVALDPETAVEITADAADTAHDVTQVEFFVEGESLGVDTEAPYAATWTTPVEEDVYELTAVATNSKGAQTTSRVVGAQVGELFGDFVPFSNAGGAYEKIGSGAYRITGAGADTWQGIDQYSSLYLPGGVDDDSWEAVVKVDAQTHTDGGAKTGLIVRNDVAQPGTSPGYALLGIRPSGGVEWLRDPDGNGQLDASDAAGSTAYPTWLKIRRDGTSYTAFYSRNGTTWNQVGPTATLTGAATPQDIGMVTVSHAATAGSADFSEFSVDTDPVQVDPEQTYPPLSCLGPLSDEFTGGLNGKWSVRQATGVPVKTVGGALQLPVTSSDINEATPGPISFVGQPAPSGSWEATTKITLDHATHWQYAGLLLHRSDDEYNKLAFVRHQNGNRFLEFQTETGGARTTHATENVAVDFPTTIHLKLTSDGTSLTAAYSTNGETWLPLEGSAPAKADAQLGLVAAGDTGATPRVASVDWFRVTPDREAPAFTTDDEFDGDALDGCRWAETVRYDADHVEVAGGELRVTTQPGDINGNNPLNPRNFVLQAAPEGDWVATTRFKAPLKHRYQLAGLLMYADDDNYVKADVVAYNGPGSALDLRAELAAEVAGAGAGGGNITMPTTSESGYWYLRVTKAGASYTAEVSDGGAYPWTPISTGVSFDQPLTGLGLMAIGPEQEEPVVVGFDYFHLDTGAEPGDTTAPTTELTLDPAAPDGANDWYVTAPSFTLGADDGDGSGVASSDYRIGDGEWTPYDGTVSLADVAELVDGTVTIGFRSTDVAGNVEEAGSVSVDLDRVAPVTEAVVATEGDAEVVTLTASDATSGVAGTEVKVDDGEWAAYAGPVPVAEPGDHVVSFHSTDEAGLVETTKTVTVSVGDTEPGDTTAPTTELTLDPAAPDGANDWYVTAPSFTLGADDGDGSGVASSDYRIGDGEWTPYDGAVSLADLGATDGTVEVHYRSTDTTGNVEVTRTTSIQLDRVAPATEARTSAAGRAAVVTLTAGDATSGVAGTEVKVDDGDWVAYTGPVTVDRPGSHVVSFRSTDRAGLVEAVGTVTVEVDEPAPGDTAAPTTALTFVPAAPDGDNGWYTTAPSFTLSAADGRGSGVTRTEWRIGNGAWTTYAGGPVTLTDVADGTVEVQFRSTDAAGNVEVVRTSTFRIDRIAPVTTAAKGAATGLVADTAATMVTLTATDATSGVAGTEVRVDDGAWAAYAGPVTVDEPGTHVVSFRSTDRAGLVESVRSVEVTVDEADTVGPTVTVRGLRDGAVYGHSKRPNLRWNVTPTGDEVVSVTARLDGRAVEPGRVDLAQLKLRRHTLVVSATDAAGNTTTVRVRFTVGTSYVDVKRLVRRYAEDGSMPRSVRNELVAGLNRANRLDERRPRLAIKQLKEVRRDVRKVDDKAHRRVLKKDVSALIRALR